MHGSPHGLFALRCFVGRFIPLICRAARQTHLIMKAMSKSRKAQFEQCRIGHVCTTLPTSAVTLSLGTYNSWRAAMAYALTVYWKIQAPTQPYRPGPWTISGRLPRSVGAAGAGCKTIPSNLLWIARLRRNPSFLALSSSLRCKYSCSLGPSSNI